MDSREYSEWIAVHRYYHPLPDDWQQVGLVASATLAPYCRRGSTPKPQDFVPTATPPQHEMQIRDAVERLSRDLEAG